MPISSQEFDIKILHLNWIKHQDDPADLCAHGSVRVVIAGKIIVDEEDGDGWTLSAAALNLMRTLGRDYKADDFASQLIPCCGFFLIANDGADHVEIYGCPNGFDWTIKHEGKQVKHTTNTGEQGTIDQKEYQKLVLAFADQVQQFYRDSAPKELPDDEFDRKGYLAFWTEWMALRSKWA